MRKGVALITVIWILAILTVIIGILAYLTTSDIAFTFIFNKQRLALASSEYGKNDVVSKIPQYDLLGAMAANDVLFFSDSLYAAYKFDITPKRSYLISPMPFPHGTLQWGTGGRWLKVFDFTTGGRCETARGNVERVVNVGAAYENPLTAAGSVGHTMY